MLENLFFVLEDGIVRPARDLDDFEEAMRSPERRIGRDAIVEPDGQLVEICTSFMGLNQNPWRSPPVLFETMIFGGKFHLYQRRYYTMDEARDGHAAVLEQVKANTDDIVIQ